MIDDDDAQVITEYFQARQDLDSYSKRQRTLLASTALSAIAAVFFMFVSVPAAWAVGIIAIIMLIWTALYSVNDNGHSKLHDYEKNFQRAEVKYYIVMQREYDVYRTQIIQEFNRIHGQEEDS